MHESCFAALRLRFLVIAALAVVVGNTSDAAHKNIDVGSVDAGAIIGSPGQYRSGDSIMVSNQPFFVPSLLASHQVVSLSPAHHPQWSPDA